MSELGLERPKVILLDMDATIQGPAANDRPSEITNYWIRRTVGAGIGLAVITGRPYEMARPAVRSLGVDLLCAFDGGGLNITPVQGIEWSRNPISKDSQMAALAVAQSLDIPLYNSRQQRFDANNELIGRPIRKRRDMPANNTKLYANKMEPDLAGAFVAELGKQVDGIAAYASTSWTPSENCCDVHITSGDATKEQAARYIFERYAKVRPEEVWVFGDSKLDLPMLLIDGVVSFAPGNAPDDVKRAVNYVVGPWYEEGVPDFLRTELFHSDEPLDPQMAAVDYRPICQTTA